MKSIKVIYTSGLAIALICVSCMLSACSSPQHRETAEMTQMMAEQMNALRAQFVAQGATAEQLREFDRQMVKLKKSMHQLESQMNAIQAANGR